MDCQSLLRLASVLVPLSLLLFLFRRRKRESPLSLQGRVVAVTGASSGLGASCAKLFHSIGCRVVLCGRDVAALERLAVAFDQEDSNSFVARHRPKCVHLDLADYASVKSSAEAIASAFGAVDILINNAGISYRGEIRDTDVAVDVKLMTVNYLSQVALTKALLPRLLDQAEGQRSHIVSISSVQGKISIPFRSAYSASKHALQSFFDCLRAEMAAECLSIHVVSPGYMKTNLSINAVTGDGATYGVLDETTASGASPDDVARDVVDCILRERQDFVVAPVHVRLAIYLRALVPALYFLLMKKRALKYYKQKNM